MHKSLKINIGIIIELFLYGKICSKNWGENSFQRLATFERIGSKKPMGESNGSTNQEKEVDC